MVTFSFINSSRADFKLEKKFLIAKITPPPLPKKKGNKPYLILHFRDRGFFFKKGVKKACRFQSMTNAKLNLKKIF